MEETLEKNKLLEELSDLKQTKIQKQEELENLNTQLLEQEKDNTKEIGE